MGVVIFCLLILFIGYVSWSPKAEKEKEYWKRKSKELIEDMYTTVYDNRKIYELIENHKDSLYLKYKKFYHNHKMGDIESDWSKVINDFIKHIVTPKMSKNKSTEFYLYDGTDYLEMEIKIEELMNKMDRKESLDTLKKEENSVLWQNIDSETIKTKIDNTNIDKKYEQLNTALMLSAEYNPDPEVIKTLIDMGVDTDTKNNALMIAAERNNSEIVNVLIKAKANVNYKTDLGNTVLMGAAKYNYDARVIKALINAGADIKSKDRFKDDALLMAAEYNENSEVIKILINAGADVNIKDENGYTVLMRAAEYNNPDVVKTLIDAGAHVNACDNNGNTALHEALHNRYGEIISILLSAGAKINPKSFMFFPEY